MTCAKRLTDFAEVTDEGFKIAALDRAVGQPVIEMVHRLRPVHHGQGLKRRPHRVDVT